MSCFHYSLETGSLTEPGWQPASHNDLLSLQPHSVWVTRPAFYIGVRGLKSGPTLLQQALLLIEPYLQPTVMFCMGKYSASQK